MAYGYRPLGGAVLAPGQRFNNPDQKDGEIVVGRPGLTRPVSCASDPAGTVPPMGDGCIEPTQRYDVAISSAAGSAANATQTLVLGDWENLTVAQTTQTTLAAQRANTDSLNGILKNNTGAVESGRSLSFSRAALQYGIQLRSLQIDGVTASCVQSLQMLVIEVDLQSASEPVFRVIERYDYLGSRCAQNQLTFLPPIKRAIELTGTRFVMFKYTTSAGAAGAADNLTLKVQATIGAHLGSYLGQKMPVLPSQFSC